MKLTRTKIPDVVIIEPQIFSDDRGWFMETFHEKKFHEALTALGLPTPRAFVQDNQSNSKKGVIRGLHLQKAPFAQGKLVRAVKGSIWDVAVDVRPNSATLGQWVGVELSAENKKTLWIPEGFAHGFLVLENDTHAFYKATDFYHKESEASICWNDRTLAIDWPILDVEPVISTKDTEAASFQDFLSAEQ